MLSDNPVEIIGSDAFTVPDPSSEDLRRGYDDNILV